MGKKSNKEAKHQQKEQLSQKQADREYKKQKQEEERKKEKRKRNHEKTSTSSEDLLFDQFLQEQHQLTVRIMRGDGNCLFRSIAHQLSNFQSDLDHMIIRHQIVHYIQQKKEYFQLFFDEEADGDFPDYLQEMLNFGVWGGHFELYAAAQCLFLSIHVYQWNMPTYVIQCTEDNNPLQKSLRIIQLSYHGGCHFNSVVPMSVAMTSITPNNRTTAESHIDNVVSSTLYVHVNSNVSESQQEAIETISKAVPWVSVHEIRLALEWNENDIENSIELLCTNLESIQVGLRQEENEKKEKEKKEEEEQKRKEWDEKKDAEANTTTQKPQRFSKVKMKKNEKQAVADDGKAADESNKAEDGKENQSIANSSGGKGNKPSQAVETSRQRPLSKKEKRQQEKNKSAPPPPPATSNSSAATSGDQHNNHGDHDLNDPRSRMRAIVT